MRTPGVVGCSAKKLLWLSAMSESLQHAWLSNKVLENLGIHCAGVSGLQYFTVFWPVRLIREKKPLDERRLSRLPSSRA